MAPRFENATIGPYELHEVLGSGGMATVFRAVHQDTKQVVAVKAYKSQYIDQPVLRKRFENEFHASRRLDHPNIVKALEYGIDDDAPFIAMEFVDGKSLAAILQNVTRLDEAEATRIMVQIADGLQHAHNLGFVHRDIKPANILISHDGQAKLTDFGLIKDLEGDENLTRTWTTLGTICFVAPEQFEDAKRVTPLSDIYGLGATLYQMVTGSLPFPGNKSMTILTKKLANDFVPARSLMPEISAQMDRVISRSMEGAPAKRHENCSEFIRSLTGKSLEEHRAKRHPVSTASVFDLDLTHNQGSDRRQAMRFDVLRDASCRPIRGNIKDHWNAKIVDLSLTGCRLTVPRRFESGSLLQLDFANQEGEPFTLLATVRWVKGQGQAYEIGVLFHKSLSDVEVVSLMDKKNLSVQFDGE